jgi:putative transport protein
MGAVSWLIESSRAHPELALFLTLGLGYALGKLRIGSNELGSVIGVFLVGVAIGQFGIPGREARRRWLGRRRTG